MGRISQEQIDRAIDDLLHGRPVPKGTVLELCLLSEIATEKAAKAGTEERKAA